MKIERVRLECLHEDPANARTHGSRNIDAIKASIKKFNQVEPLVVQKSTNVIIGGNGRYRAMVDLGFSECDVYYIDVDNTTATALGIALNKTGDLAGWDDEILGKHLHGLDADGWDLGELGFDDDELKELLFDGEGGGGLTDDDEVPDDAPAICQPGQLWKLGEHRLLCGDCTVAANVERLMAGEKADMVFTDPPYGIGYSGGIQFKNGVAKKENRDKLVGDESTDAYRKIAPIIKRFVDGPGYIWFAFSNAKDTIDAIDAIGDIHALIIWNKVNATYAAMNAHYKQRHEPCLYIKTKGSTLRWDGPTDECTVWDMKRDPRNDLHPTQKPVELAERAIGNHKVNSVFDPFLGSGSTLIACEKTGRRCYGMEIDQHYCDIIIKRWSDFTGKTAELIDG